MKNKTLLSLLALPALFAACSNEDFTEEFNAGATEKDLVENVAFNFGLDTEATTKGAYAGAKGDVTFAGFYLEPEYSTNEILLSDQTALHGDMVGLCLTQGANAITNYPFYIAGYGSKAPAKGANNIFTFAAQSDPLYNLGLDSKTQVEDKALHNGQGAKADADIAASVAAIKKVKAGEDLGANELDVRKGIIRTNAGIMTGDYVAYYPYNAKWTEPTALPVPATKSILDYGAQLTKTADASADKATAIQTANLFKQLFAVSAPANTINVKGGTKAGDVKVTPLNAFVLLKIANTHKSANKEIKRVTMQVADAANSKETDFNLGGTVALNNRSVIVPGKGQTSSFVGVQFTATTVDPGTTKENPYWAAFSCFPATDQEVSFKVYDTEGNVAVLGPKPAPKANQATTYNLDLNGAKWEKIAVREIFTAADFLAEMGTEGTLKLMADITGKGAVNVTTPMTKALNITGNHTLELTFSGSGALQAALTAEAGTKLAIKDLATSKAASIATKGELVLDAKAALSVAIHVEADKLVNNVVAGLTLTDAKVRQLRNNKVLTLDANVAGKKVVEVSELNNYGQVTVDDNKDNVLTVGTLKNWAVATPAATVTVGAKAKLAATTIVNEAAVVKPAKEAGVITISGETTAAAVENNGTMTWASAKDMNLNVVNNGTFEIKSACNFAGTMTNNKDFKVNEVEVQGTKGEIVNNANFEITTTGNLVLAATKLTAAKGEVNVVGNINGSSNITVAEGATMVKTVEDDAHFISANSTVGVSGKFTGIRTKGALTLTAKKVVKTVYATNNICLASATELQKGLIVEKGAILDAYNNATISAITINKGAILTMQDATIAITITVTGVITNNGKYVNNNAIVNCGGIVTGEGATWDGYPNF